MRILQERAFKRITSCVVILCLIISMLPQAVFAADAEPIETPTEPTTYVVDESGKIVSDDVDTIDIINNDNNTESEVVDKNVGASGSIRAAETTSVVEESPTEDIKSKNTIEANEDVTSDTLLEEKSDKNIIIENNNEENSADSDVNLYDLLLLQVEIETFIAVLEDVQNNEKLHNLTEDEIVKLLEYVKEQFEQNEKYALVVSILMNLENAPKEKSTEIEGAEAENTTEESIEENAQNQENCEPSEDKKATDTLVKTKDSAEVEESAEDPEITEVPESLLDEQETENETLYDQLLKATTFDEIYNIITVEENLVAMQGWTTEEIENACLFVLEYEDERIDEVLLVLYSLPNAPDLFGTYEVPDDGRKHSPGLGGALMHSIRNELYKNQCTSIAALIHEGNMPQQVYTMLHTEQFKYSLFEYVL